MAEHSNDHEEAVIAPANKSSGVAEDAVTRPTGRLAPNLDLRWLYTSRGHIFW